MATGYARLRPGVRNITPAEALLELLQITRNDAEWLSQKVSTAANDEALIDGGAMVDFVAMRERALDRYYKVAVSAHTAKALDIANELEEAKAEVMATILLPAIERLKVDEDLRKSLLSAIDVELVELDSKAYAQAEVVEVPVEPAVEEGGEIPY